MNLNEIKEILKLIDEAKLQEVEIEKENLKIRIKRYSDQPTSLVPTQVVYPAPPIIYPPVVQETVQAPIAVTEQKTDKPAPVSEANLIPIKSPMTGTFYSSSSPDKPPFVTVGKELKQGEPICVIEAMKLFNEIEAEETGVVEKILIKDGQAVELDQTLFLLRS